MNRERYQKQILLPELGLKGQGKLLESRVLVVGAGGLGVPVLQYLVGMGVGTVGIADADRVSIHNLHRQILYATSDVGRLKVEVARERLELLNPEVELRVHPEFVNNDNAESMLSAYDLVVDCTDNLPVRYILDDICAKARKPLIYGALYKFEGQISVFNYQDGPSYRSVFPDDSAKVDNCSDIGVVGVLPGIIGTYQAMEVVKVITGLGEVLSGKLLIVNAATSDHFVMQIGGKKPVKTPKKQTVVEDWVTWEELEKMDEAAYQWLDIRPSSVYEADHHPWFQNVPFTSIFDFEPEANKDLVLVCQRGQTTVQAERILKDQFPKTKIIQVKGGYLSR